MYGRIRIRTIEPEVTVAEEAPEIAARCQCGRCDAACASRLLAPCCGACFDGTIHEQAEITWSGGE